MTAALILRAIVVIHEQPPEPEWTWGVMLEGSLEATREGYRFKVRDFSSSEPCILDVLYNGTLPDMVCEGQDASIEGRFDGDVFIATNVRGPSCTKGDPCRQFVCLPEGERPIECRRTFRFE